MTTILTTLAGLFAWLMLALIVPSPQSLVLILSGAAIYVVYFGFLAGKPVYSIYGFVLGSLFFPKGGNNYILFRVEEIGAQITLFSILQLAAAVSIGIRILRQRPRSWPALHPSARAFGLIATLTILLAAVFASYRLLTGELVDSSRTLSPVLYTAPLLTGTLFFLGCCRFVTRVEQIERIFLIILAFGGTLVLESVSSSLLGLELFRSELSLHRTGRFMSFFLFDPHLVGIVSMAALACGLYFAQKHQSRMLLIVAAACLVPTVLTFNRASILAAVIAGAFAATALGLATRRTVFAAGLLTASLVLVGTVRRLAVAAGLLLLELRGGSLAPWAESWQARVGSYLRGVDVIIESFPTGVGALQVQAAFTSSQVRSHFDLSQAWAPAVDFYTLIVEGYSTGPHNAFITFVAEYGVPGLVLEVILVAATLQALRRLYHSKRTWIVDPYRSIRVVACAFLVGIAVYALFQDVILYWLTLFFFFLGLPTHGDSRSRTGGLRPIDSEGLEHEWRIVTAPV